MSLWVSRITGILNTMIGLLAGFLAGRTDRDLTREAPRGATDMIRTELAELHLAGALMVGSLTAR